MKKEIKSSPGIKTSEFWVVMAGMILTGIGVDSELVSQAQAYIPGALAGIYTLCRSLIKAVQERKPE